jgi:hypothetical protein
MSYVVPVVVPMLISVLHVFFIILALGMPMALYLFAKAGQWSLFTRWAIVTGFCVFMAIWGAPDLRRRWTEHVGGEKLPPKLIAYIMAGFFAPMLIPEPARLARKRLRHERGGSQRRRRHEG